MVTNPVAVGTGFGFGLGGNDLFPLTNQLVLFHGQDVATELIVGELERVVSTGRSHVQRRVLRIRRRSDFLHLGVNAGVLAADNETQSEGEDGSDSGEGISDACMSWLTVKGLRLMRAASFTA